MTLTLSLMWVKMVQHKLQTSIQQQAKYQLDPSEAQEIHAFKNFNQKL